MHALFGKRLRAHLLLLIMASALIACESSDSQDGPASSDGSLVINPTSTTFAVGPPGPGCVLARQNLVTYTISTFDSRGRPLGNADIEITLDFADNTTLIGPVVTSLIDGDSGATVSDIGDPVPFKTTTDEIGNKTMFITYDTSAGCTYTGSMTVVSGSLSELMEFNVDE